MMLSQEVANNLPLSRLRYLALVVPLASHCSLLEAKQWNSTTDTPYYSSTDQLDSDSETKKTTPILQVF